MQKSAPLCLEDIDIDNLTMAVGTAFLHGIRYIVSEGPNVVRQNVPGLGVTNILQEGKAVGLNINISQQDLNATIGIVAQYLTTVHKHRAEKPFKLPYDSKQEDQG